MKPGVSLLRVRGVLGWPYREEVTGSWRKLLDVELRIPDPLLNKFKSGG